MQINGTSMKRVMSLAAMIAVMAGTAAANAQEGDDRMQGFDQPLKGRRGQESRATSTTVMSESDGEHTYTVKIEGDKVTGEIDGKELPEKRLRQRGGRVEILDENGDVLKTFHTNVVVRNLYGAAPRFRVETLEPGQGGALAGPGGVTAWAPAATPPKAMMGVTMTDAEDGGAMIDTVMEGMPAEKAGLKPGDRVVKANGKDVDNQQALREVIAKAEPGDTLTLTVDRDGKQQELKVKLAKWDQTKVAPAPMPDVFRQFHGGNENLDEARESLRKALDLLKDTKRVEGKALENAREALENALEKLDEAKVHGFRWNADDQLRVYSGRGQKFVLPQGAAPIDEDMARQMERLNAQLERMNKRMEELEKNRR
ncbi:MAG TPA: PDZ domain-containing protein [Phycisphaerales bacterium]|nr:PDZ domain-containing protein [Phycisphaerales bacterium]